LAGAAPPARDILSEWSTALSVSNSLLGELEESLKAGSPEKRVETLRRVTDLFLNDSDRLNDQQVAVFDDVLVHLIQKIETKALVQLSQSLAPIPNAPTEVVQRLARDVEIAVAGPVLTSSHRLTESDLTEIAKSQSQAHLLAISGRAFLTETVTDVLVGRGNRSVTDRLARNSGARFSEAGFATLVKKSETDESLAEQLGLRLDIPFQLLQRLLSRASDVVRSRLLACVSPENQERIQQALASIVNSVGREFTGPRNYVFAEGHVQRMNREGKLNESVLVGFAQERRYEEVVATLALFCGAKVETIELLMKNVSHDGLIVACKAAKLSWPTVFAIMKTRFSHHSISDEELDIAKESFLEVSQAAAQRTMRFMQVQQAAKQAN
jgi:hypothetical protein